MKSISSVFFFCWVCVQTVFGQIDSVGSGRAIAFDGVDDFIELGNIFDDLSLPVTVSVWVNLSPGNNYAYPILNTQDNLPLYNGVTFLAQPTGFSIQYGDGRGEDNPAFRRGKGVTVDDIANRWVNLTAIMRGRSDMDLFLNGYNIGGSYSGSTDFPMSSQSGGDIAKIGYWFSNGSSFYFKGMMDELRIYNRSLSEQEIRDQMCKKLKGDESGLIGYWTFDETSGSVVEDHSMNKFDGILKGNPTRVFSGAPIGNASKFVYPTGWENVELTLDQLSVSDVSGGFGVHIYRVDNEPVMKTGLPTQVTSNPYFGVFVADENTGNLFDVVRGGSAGCSEFFSRADNSATVWTQLSSYQNISERIELVPIENSSSVQLDLGADQILCGENSYLLSSGISPSDVNTFEWNTGAVSSAIEVTQSGTYWLRISGACEVVADTVTITIAEEVPEFSLGPDRPFCAAIHLQPFNEENGFEYIWQDGSTGPAFSVTAAGKYWVTVSTECGSVVDSVEFTNDPFYKTLPNVITPNGDDWNETFFVPQAFVGSEFSVFNRWGKSVYSSEAYENNWDASHLTSGTYYYLLSGVCGEFKGHVHVLK